MGGGRLFERTLSKTRLFSRGGGRLLEGGRLFQNLSPRGGANSKRGAYWKLGAYSSIYGMQYPNNSGKRRFIHFKVTIPVQQNLWYQ